MQSSKQKSEGLLDHFDLSDDFDHRLAEAMAPKTKSSPSGAVDIVFERPFTDEEIEQRLGRASETSPTTEASAPQTPTDRPSKQFAFYEKRLAEKLAGPPATTPEECMRQSAQLILYILQEFQYPIADDLRDNVIHRMEKTLGIEQQSEAATRKARAPFLTDALREKVETLYTAHTRRYVRIELELKKRAAREQQRQRREAAVAERKRAEQRRLEKERRRAETTQAVSEDKLAQIEKELDEMLAMTASSQGLDPISLMRLGYEEEAPSQTSPKVPPPVPERPVMPSKAQEIIERNNERRRQRGLLEPGKS